VSAPRAVLSKEEFLSRVEARWGKYSPRKVPPTVGGPSLAVYPAPDPVAPPPAPSKLPKLTIPREIIEAFKPIAVKPVVVNIPRPQNPFKEL